MRRALVALRTRDWEPHSRLFVQQEAAEWVLSYEARQLERTATKLGILLGPPAWAKGVSEQSIFHLSQFTLLLHDFEKRGNHLGFAYFHGRPGTPGMPEFDVCFDAMRRRHEEIDRVQVTNREMEELVLETGMAPEKVHLIPIGIDVETFPFRSPAGVATARGVLRAARVGLRRRLLPERRRRLGRGARAEADQGAGRPPGRRRAAQGADSEVVFLLTGPARGFVKAGLERLGIPYRHVVFRDVDAVARAYEAIDVCIVTSRDEGGPRAVLEAMATGVPLVTTGSARPLIS